MKYGPSAYLKKLKKFGFHETIIIGIYLIYLVINVTLAE